MIEWQRQLRGTRAWRPVVLAGLVVLCLVALAAGLRPALHRPPTTAQIVLAGAAHGSASQTGDDDPDLAADEAEAGAIWAHNNHPASSSACPHYSTAFRVGCVGALTAAKRGQR
jgi:hypothetical protein